MRQSVRTLRQAVAATLLTALPLAAVEPAQAAESGAETRAAQPADTKISGRVVDDKGEGMPGVTVVVKGTTNGVSTDPDGRFTLTVPDNATLVVSSVGFLTQEVAVGPSTELTIRLAPDTKALDEVVVTGYQTQRKADLTGAVAVVKTDEIKDMASNDVTRNLQGRVPGVQITTDGAPGSAATVRIRGIGTLGNNDPLYVIDGIPTKEGINQINQNDIESIQVLKDASAASIYGSRAGNGVIIITTKKAKKGATRVNFSTFFTAQTPGPHLELLNTLDYGRVYWQAKTNDGGTPNLPYYTFQTHQGPNGQPVLDGVGTTEFIDADKTMRAADTDWFKETQQNALIQSYNLDVSSGGERGGALFSVNYYQNSGTLKYSGFDRMTARLNSDYNFLDGRLKVGENLTLVKSQRAEFDLNLVRDRTTQLPSIVPVHTVDGVGWGGPVSGMSDRDNPLRLLADNEQNRSTTGRAFGNFFADAEIIKGLHLRSSFGIDYSIYKFRQIYKTYKAGFLSEQNNRVTNNERFWGNWVWQNTLNYTVLLGAKHQLDFLAGAERISYYDESSYASRTNFASEDPDYAYLDAGAANKDNGGGATAYRLASSFGKINYSFADKYLLSATLRRDGSSRFGQDKRFGVFPAVSAGWRLSEETFVKNQAAFFSDLKLRAGWGQTGNQDIANFASRGLYQSLLGTFDPNFDYDHGTAYDIYGNDTNLPSGYRRFQRANPGLKWETTTQTNVGVDFGLLENRLSGTVDYFVKNSKDILVNLPFLAVVGEGGDQFVNGASIQNRGWEFLLGYQNELTNGLTYSVTGNLSTYRNELTFLPTEVINAYGGNGQDVTRLGHSISAVYGYVADGLYQNTADVANGPTQVGAAPGRIRYKDLNNDGKVDNFDQTWLTERVPDFSYGLNLGTGFRGFDLQIFLQGVQGLYAYNDAKFRTDFASIASNENWGARLLDAWTPANSGSTIPAATLINNNNEGRSSTYFIENASYLKLRNIQLGYSLPAVLTSKIKLQGVRVYVQGQNLFTLKSQEFTGADPEVTNYQYPLPRVFTTGLNVSF
ncbi:SusC/RagA family TonB-linked outer membrane protein [Hymenobacter chitinivorans]|uniref:TonB-linked SusC/RagA family outer membrane protein n=1 Tax=Hymenobacter chitinivorans DSM 11115 TaxID=1121954 RepID=A0A2M9BSP7_9BACT|nr:TonB-dependent receptor [Hymenobacter chitinivorans]PJJ60974.1 TonB-linked SusC/RagA family outer membrane protein [Hymenobacter chitinivorans DSM 11115]